MVKRLIISILALSLLTAVNAQENMLPKNEVVKVEAGEYWIDNDYNDKTQFAVDSSTVAFTIDASLLNEGLHTLSYRVRDNEGMYSPLSTWMFMKNALRDTSIVNKVTMVEYWIDNDSITHSNNNVINDTIAFSVDASALSAGLHTLNYRVKDVLNNYSATHTWAFFKNEPKATKISWYKYWWNNNTDKAERVDVDCDSTVFLFSQQLEIPHYAKTDGYSRNSTARFNIVFGDDAGNVSNIEYADIAYPDEISPVSSIAAENQSDGVKLTWSANEDEIADYNVYVSENDMPFYLWMPNTTETTSVFKTQAGVTYRFTVTARDKTGNIEKLNENKAIEIKQNN